MLTYFMGAEQPQVGMEAAHEGVQMNEKQPVVGAKAW